MPAPRNNDAEFLEFAFRRDNLTRGTLNGPGMVLRDWEQFQDMQHAEMAITATAAGLVDQGTTVAPKKKSKQDREAPITIKTRSRTSNGQRVYYLQFYRNGELIDERSSAREAQLVNTFLTYRRDFEEDMTYQNYRDTNGVEENGDLRGESIQHNIRPRTRAARIDRRALRPKDDVVTEDNLALDIDPNQIDEPVQNIVDEYDATIEDDIEEFLEDF